MGKALNDNEFRIQSHLNKPPKILLRAVEGLQSDYALCEGELTHYIQGVLMKLGDYRLPGREQDQLFNPHYPHDDSREDCSTCDTSQILKRACRESDDPVIHYGLIASGDAVMRSSQYRDRLRDTWGVMCFEMEAAGLMDDFPCLVIRGICDYSDEHKNKLWQPYSSVAAGAYAKDLLRTIQPQDVNTMDMIKYSMS